MLRFWNAGNASFREMSPSDCNFGEFSWTFGEISPNVSCNVFKRVIKCYKKYFLEKSPPCRGMYYSIIGKARKRFEEGVLNPFNSTSIQYFFIFFCFRIAKHFLSGKKKWTFKIHPKPLLVIRSLQKNVISLKFLLQILKCQWYKWVYYYWIVNILYQ